MANEIEIWKDIPEWEGIYQASNFGRIKSLHRIVVCKNDAKLPVKEKTMRFAINRGGYYKTILRHNGKKVLPLVHRLIAKTFIPNPENKKTVNHKNGIKTDNNIENLEWATIKENNIHAFKTGLKVIPSGKDCYWLYGKTGKKSLVAKPIIQMDLMGKEIKKHDSLSDAVRCLGLRDSSGITKCVTGKAKTSGGYKWKFTTKKLANNEK